MSKEESLTFAFENDRVTFKSYLSKFTSKHQKEFELKAKKINLDLKFMIYLKVRKLIILRILLLGIQSIGMNIALALLILLPKKIMQHNYRS